jgi:hypothetical protein
MDTDAEREFGSRETGKRARERREGARNFGEEFGSRETKKGSRKSVVALGFLASEFWSEKGRGREMKEPPRR